MSKYIYKGFEFESECTLYRITPADIEQPRIQENSGICTIFFPRSISHEGRITSKFPDIHFTISGLKFRQKSLDPVSLTIIQFDDLSSAQSDSTYDSLVLISNNVTKQQVIDLLTESLFESEDIESDYTYQEILTLLINKDIDTSKLKLRTKPTNLQATKTRYILSFTQVIDAIITRLSTEVAKYGFGTITRSNKNRSDSPTRELCLLSFDDYNKDYFRLFPNWNNEITQYEIPLKLDISTTSVSKFERLINEFNTLYFLSNIRRVDVQDIRGDAWKVALEWKDYSTNSPESVQNDQNEVAYNLVLNFTATYYAVRNNDQYYKIGQILQSILTRKLGHV